MKKVIFVIFLMIIFTGIAGAQKNHKSAVEKYSLISYKIVLNGDAISAVCNSPSLPPVKSILKNQNLSLEGDSPLYTTTFTYTGCSTIYDMQSNGTVTNIVQDPNNLDRIHVVCMYAPPGDGTSFPNRRSKYYYSSNRGTSFYYISDVPSGVRSGYPAITIAPNGNALIGNHSTNNTSPTQCSHFYYDAAPGLGSFTELYKTALMDYIWPRMVFTNSLTNTNKFIAIQSPNGRDSCFWDICTSINPSPGTFSSWYFMYSDQAETYSIARGADGRIGIVYHNNDALLVSDYGDLYFIESTNHGSTFTTPLKIFNANVSPSGDSLAPLRGLQIAYLGNVPKVAFETIKQTTAGSYYPNATDNKIRFWSSSLPGSDPNRSISIATTTMVGGNVYINTNTSSNDVLANICRPTIGVSADGLGVFVAFMAPSVYYGGSVDTVSFNDFWVTYSANGGANWVVPSKVNSVTPIKDWAYPSISPSNDYTSSYYYINMTIQQDSLPGSYVNFPGNGESQAKQYFARVQIPRLVGVSNTNQGIPKEYRLYQNFPNPFNPATKVRFSLPKTSNSKLVVYNILGKEIATLVKQELNAGTYELTFDGSNLSSGIYFYKLETESYTDIKRMILIK